MKILLTLEFSIHEKGGESVLTQTATFRPRGLWGRLYWVAMLPFHFFLFEGMVGRLGEGLR